MPKFLFFGVESFVDMFRNHVLYANQAGGLTTGVVEETLPIDLSQLASHKIFTKVLYACLCPYASRNGALQLIGISTDGALPWKYAGQSDIRRHYAAV